MSERHGLPLARMAVPGVWCLHNATPRAGCVRALPFSAGWGGFGDGEAGLAVV